MKILQSYNEFHDWSIDGVIYRNHELQLYVFFNSDRKVIKFGGASRFIINEFMMQNIIYDLKIIDVEKLPELYEQQLIRLKQVYHHQPKEQKIIAVLNSSVGAELVVEFSSLNVTDAPMLME